MSLEDYAEMLEEAEKSVDFWYDLALTDFSRELHARMRELNVSPAELARRMGTSKAYVSQLLDGGNFTLQTMVKIAMALGAVVRIRLEGNEKRAAVAAKESAREIYEELDLGAGGYAVAPSAEARRGIRGAIRRKHAGAKG